MEWEEATRGGSAARKYSISLIALGITACIAVISLLFNVGFVAIWATDESSARTRIEFVEQQRDSLDKSKQEIESALRTERDLTSRLDDSVRSLEESVAEKDSRILDLERQLDIARHEYEQATLDPSQLRLGVRRAVLQRLNTFFVSANIGDGTPLRTISEVDVVNQVRQIGAREGLQIDAEGDAHLVITISARQRRWQDDHVAIQIRLAVLDRWRIPGSDRSYSVIVDEASVLLLVASEDVRADVLGGVDAVVEAFAREFRSVKQ